MPPGYEVAIVPGSDTGAVELAMWNLLGARGVDVLAWDVFGRNWLRDVVDELKLPDARVMDAEPGHLPDLAKVDFSRDVVFTWNGTTTGVKVPNAAWIPDDRAGLTICDATSALLGEDIDLDEDRRADLFLAEGARRRSRARHDRSCRRARSIVSQPIARHGPCRSSSA